MRLHLPGADVSLHAGFLPAAEADELAARLIRTLPWERRDVVIRGRRLAQPRLTSWHGDGGDYTYSGATFVANPWTPELATLRDRLQERLDARFDSVLANLYRINHRDGMGLHADDEPELGETPLIASVSLGDERAFAFAPKRGRPGRRVEVPLPNGSLLVMAGDTQRNWLHGMEKPKSPARAARVNLTFRLLGR